MIKEKKNTENLIALLSDSLEKVKVMPHPLLRVLPWFLVSVIYIIIVIVTLGIRMDFESRVNDPSYVFELFYVSMITVSAAICSSWLCIPDMRGEKWLISPPIILLIGFAAWAYTEVDFAVFTNLNINWHHCHLEAVFMGVLPIIAILFVSVKGKTTHPYIMSLMNVIYAGSLGYLGLRITCASENFGHLYFTHILPYLLFAIVMAMLGRYIYRW